MTENQAPNRVSGKAVVIGLSVFGVAFFIFMLVLALRLTPAAERFHNPTRATSNK
ncbi:hypothetical protein [Urbifossiella limnaea]|uniref:Uncharacterized protein n=1 Tax=Urbifossiella limnaea TaxID=2528023 RepID=A0A517XZ22_9BACT|nr:hypothetical protein [Urbifossiella limnaea]QDU22764.1 hypothetical protein ETAA1_47500 [Urbifossiella limnaea]